MRVLVVSRRRKISRSLLDALVAEQRHLCAYCQLPFGTVVYWPGHGNVVPTVVGDHFYPHVSGGNSDRENAIAACEVCNSLKRDVIFESVAVAWEFLAARRRAKRISVAFVPSVSITRDAARWSKQYAGWLSASLARQDREDAR